MTTEKQKMLGGDLYVASDPEIAADSATASRWMACYDAASAAPASERHAMLVAGLGQVGSGMTVRSSFHCDYGYNIHLEDGVCLNFGCVVLDGLAVRIGANTQIGPNVRILRADHPRDPKLRSKMLEFGRPVTIGCNVWIVVGALILPGATMGDDAIVGAGSVVTRDVVADTTVMGIPAGTRSE